jgi:hypothetical protein
MAYRRHHRENISAFNNGGISGIASAKPAISGIGGINQAIRKSHLIHAVNINGGISINGGAGGIESGGGVMLARKPLAKATMAENNRNNIRERVRET